MTDTQDTHEIQGRQRLRLYFLRMRADRIIKYKAAIYQVTRDDMRASGLHYGRLARSLS